ncbi:hypothetical protein EUGRSUZ_F04247 [Eucalyptus grandis]|uniref:Uncharacterized protein n=2 Tax=Eucalyptus grandis TaxID=71139 RepID=A0ACC3KPQ1_EUCGR|nr:hypothetical protein EUGRSUZ_F04247 [Eucalyptus grandis]
MRPSSSTTSSSFSRLDPQLLNTFHDRLVIAPVGIRINGIISSSSNHCKRVKLLISLGNSLIQVCDKFKYCRLIKLQIPSGNDVILLLLDRSRTVKQVAIDSKNPLGTSITFVSLIIKVLRWEHLGGAWSIL